MCDGCRPRTDELRRTLIQPLQAIFSCDLTVLDRTMFLRGFMRQKWTRNLSLSLQTFRSCNQRRRHRTLAECLTPLVDKCRHSSVVAVKVIRLHMGYVDRLLSDDPALTLIHLVRDPRGLVESWRKVASRRVRRSMKQMRLNAKLICQRMTTDCRIRRQLEMKYPRRILLLRYEDLVAATGTVLDNVYSGLLQLTLPSNVDYVVNEQLRATAANGPTGTLRTNGTATATGWRRTINSDLLAYITDTCRQLLVELNYNLQPSGLSAAAADDDNDTIYGGA